VEDEAFGGVGVGNGKKRSAACEVDVEVLVIVRGFVDLGCRSVRVYCLLYFRADRV